MGNLYLDATYQASLSADFPVGIKLFLAIGRTHARMGTIGDRNAP